MAITVHYGQKSLEDRSKHEILPVHATKAYRGSRGIAPLILSPALDGGKRPNSRPPPIYSRDKTPVPVPWAAGVGPRAGIDILRRKKSIFSPLQGFERRIARPVV